MAQSWGEPAEPRVCSAAICGDGGVHTEPDGGHGATDVEITDAYDAHDADIGEIGEADVDLSDADADGD